MVTDTLYAPYVDEKYKEFSKGISLTDTLPRAGIRMPIIRSLAKEIDPTTIEEYRWHEDIILVGLSISYQNWPMEKKLEMLDKLLPSLSSWDHTDTVQSVFKPKKGEKELCYAYFTSLLKDERVYVKRIGIVWLMSNRKKFDQDTVLNLILQADDDTEYYISMAVAWTICSFFLDDPTIEPRIEELSPITQRRTWQKIRDSRRYRPEDQ